MPRIALVEGDITEQRVDAIVNAANSTLLGGGGVDGAIHDRGGPAILEECRRIRADEWPDGLPTGKAVATTAGALPARWVIHTVGPSTRKRRTPRHCSRAAIPSRCASPDELGAVTVAFPAISTGAYGYPLDEAARVAIESIRSADTEVREVRFVLFGHQAYAAFERALVD